MWISKWIIGGRGAVVISACGIRRGGSRPRRKEGGESLAQCAGGLLAACRFYWLQFNFLTFPGLAHGIPLLELPAKRFGLFGQWEGERARELKTDVAKAHVGILEGGSNRYCYRGINEGM